MIEETVTFSINEKIVTVKKGTTVYEAAKSQGVEIPIFCYYDRLPPFGACRVCLVEVEKMEKLQTSCTLVATEGMVVKTESNRATKGRAGILELLLINHPLDCPICDRGGECPLQENALEHGSGISNFYEAKRHFKKALPLGSVLMLDRERCIVCARCTRFGESIASDQALQMIDRGYKTEVGTKNQEPVVSKFIGNTIEMCPVGALTSQVYRFRARPWDNASTNSCCTLCPVGCSMVFDNRDGEIMRTRALENGQINDIWLCDKGYFGYQFIESPHRLLKPLIRKNGKLEEATLEEALSLIAFKLREVLTAGKIAAFGGNPLTTEENYLFQKLFREVFHVNNIDHRIGQLNLSLEEEFLAPGMETLIGECEELSYVYLLGLDVTENFPLLWLRLKQAINKGTRVIFIGHYLPEIANFLHKTILHEPGFELEFIEKEAEAIKKLSNEGKKGAFFVGSQYLNSENRSFVLEKLLKLKEEIKNLTLNILEGAGNSMGARMAGMRPDLKPLEEEVKEKGLTPINVLKEASKTGWDLLFVAGANPALKFPRKLFKEAREKLKFLVVQELFLTETALLADVVLPTKNYVEKEGSFITIAGMKQTLAIAKDVPDDLFSDGELFQKLAKKFDYDLKVDPDFTEVLEKNRIVIERRSLTASLKKENPKEKKASLKATFSKTLFDKGVRMQQNKDLSKLVKKPFFRMNKKMAAKYGIEKEEQIFILNGDNKIRGDLAFDETVADETLVIPLGFPELAVHDLAERLFNGLEIEIKKCSEAKNG